MIDTFLRLLCSTIALIASIMLFVGEYDAASAFLLAALYLRFDVHAREIENHV